MRWQSIPVKFIDFSTPNADMSHTKISHRQTREKVRDSFKGD